MQRLPNWAQGAIFGILIVPLAFFLKIICPLAVGCFVDPFLVVLFSPLFILESFGSEIFPPRVEILFIFLFWGTVMALVVHLWGELFPKKNMVSDQNRNEVF